MRKLHNTIIKNQFDKLLDLFIEKIKQSKEYMTIEEALHITGLSEKTLKDHMRGAVPSFGRNSWDRKEFFDYWKKLYEEKQNNHILKYEKIREILDKNV